MGSRGHGLWHRGGGRRRALHHVVPGRHRAAAVHPDRAARAGARARARALLAPPAVRLATRHRRQVPLCGPEVR